MFTTTWIVVTVWIAFSVPTPAEPLVKNLGTALTEAHCQAATPFFFAGIPFHCQKSIEYHLVTMASV